MSRLGHWLGLVVLGLATFCGAEALPQPATQPLVPLDVPRCPHAPAMNAIAGAAWEHAASVEIREVPLNADQEDRRRAAAYTTRARLMWSEDQLHVLVECGGPDFHSTYTLRDGPLYKEDVIEVFLDVKGDMRSYAEILISPRGTVFDSLHTWRVKPGFTANAIDWKAVASDHIADEGWNLDGMYTASTASSQGASAAWAVQLAIPLRTLLRQAGLPGTLSAGQVIRLNLLRYAHQRIGDQPCLIQLNWGPTMRGCPHVSPMAMSAIRLAVR